MTYQDKQIEHVIEFLKGKYGTEAISSLNAVNEEFTEFRFTLKGEEKAHALSLKYTILHTV